MESHLVPAIFRVSLFCFCLAISPAFSETAITEGEWGQVALRFVSPASPTLELVNQSKNPERPINYSIMIWNRDLPDRADPLPIPVATYPLLQGHQVSEPLNIFAPAAALLKPGNRLMGTASILLPSGARGRTYLVDLVWGKGGWFSEVSEMDTGDLLMPKTLSKEDRERYFTFIESIPEPFRVQIGQKRVGD